MRSLGLVLFLALSTLCSPAHATYSHVVTSVVTPHASGGGWTLCANPAGVFICVVAGAIVADEVRRTIDGPACATMRMRQSWFGKVRDEPKLWRKLCPRKRSNTVSVRG